MIGQAATIRMRTIDGATITFARRRSDIPLERRSCGGAPVVLTAAASMIRSERGERAVDLRVRLLQCVLRAHATGKGVVDVLVDRLRDLRIHRRDRTGLRLAQCL